MMMNRWTVFAASLVFAGCVALAGCDDGSVVDDECSMAVDKLDTCGIPHDEPGVCGDDVDRCEADCINTHPCDQITAALAGTPNAYSACDDACN